MVELPGAVPERWEAELRSRNPRQAIQPLTSMFDESRLLYDSAIRPNWLTSDLRMIADLTPTLLSYSRFHDRVDRILLGGVWPYYVVQATRHRRRVLEVPRWSEARRVYEFWVVSHTGEHGRFERSDVAGCGEAKTTSFTIPDLRTQDETEEDATPATDTPLIILGVPWPGSNAASRPGMPRWDALRPPKSVVAPVTQASLSATGLTDVDVMRFSSFELYLADLLKRDGFQILKAGGHANDKAADVIATSASARRYVVQAKHFTHGRGSVGAPAIYQVNGTAWSVHKADVAVVITNGRFTRDAERFARDQGIHMVGRERLIDWVTGVLPLGELIGED
ncbi:restriction endonuclease [Kitasatospora sp. NPDC048365]|uniref:restriction endonuclease n=1 Tax=Kitasatospora sp. NPDC048365 TaxID=3364050 RepID=UPI003718C8C1